VKQEPTVKALAEPESSALQAEEGVNYTFALLSWYLLESSFQELRKHFTRQAQAALRERAMLMHRPCSVKTRARENREGHCGIWPTVETGSLAMIPSAMAIAK
jgi:hypothetical protein